MYHFTPSFHGILDIIVSFINDCMILKYHFNALFHCILLLCRHDSISLYHFSVSFQYIIELYNFTVSHQRIVLMYHLSVPFHCTILLYHFIVPFQCISTLVKYALFQSLSMLYVYYSTYRDNKQSLQNVKTFVNFSTDETCLASFWCLEVNEESYKLKL